MDSAPPLARARLSLMMFLQYFIWSAWFPVAGYALEVLGFTEGQQSWIMATTAIGAIAAPLLVGLIADRFFPTQYVLAALHILGGICLCLAAGQDEFGPFMTLITINGLCYMPTLALTNSLAFRNIADSEKDFPIIRVWGTIGWVVAGLSVGVVLGQSDNTFIYLAGGAGILMGLYCLTLPHTPPKSSEEASQDPLGLRAVAMLKEPSFAIFCVAAFLVCLILGFYWTATNPFLLETDRPAPAALMTLGQISEIFFMAAMPWFLARLGLKRMLLIGILAWAVRYACFGYAMFSLPAIIFALLLHGICYDFFFVAAFIYVDKKAPEDLRASAQSLITLIMLGVGMFAGTKLAGYTLDQYPSLHAIDAVDADGEPVVLRDDQPILDPGTGQPVRTVPLPDWPTSQPYTGPLRYLDLSAVIKSWLEDAPEQEPVVSLARQLGSDQENEITVAQVESLEQETITIEGLTYPRASLVEAFRAADGDGDGTVTRSEWRAAQARDWRGFWTWPMFGALLTGLFFWLGFHDRVRPDQPDDEPKT